ncbi:GHKL domain-containing protein [Tissierella sp.]|uniref:sensor histidine kinase n=1 Tax=Tissierella sp. TaxID=41274 RepID=UPI00285DF46F|nr:GHKL domain-containing protein [Tissierella sp.]MDR7856822.1 GHKL domain-containing protein [Tissierella sp.]
MNLLWMNLFTNTLDTLLVFWFLIKVLRKGKIDRKSDWLFLIGLIFLNSLINLMFDNISILEFAAIFTISNIIYSYLLDEKFYRTIIYSILATGLMFIIEIAVVNIITLIFKVTPAMILEMNIYRIIGIFASKISFFLVIKYLAEKIRIPIYTRVNKVTPILLIGLFNIMIIFMTFTLYKNMKIESIYGYLYLLCTGFGIIIFSFVIYSTTKKKIYQDQQEIIWKVKEEEFHKKDFYINSMNDILQTIRSQRHDLNNYLGTLYGLISLGDFEDAKRYIKKINGRISNMNSIIETNHPVITALISMKKNKAFDDGIEMKFDINLPKELPFDFVDLSIILGNLLDNAIEACRLIAMDFERIINVFISYDNDYLTIQIDNPKDESIKLEKEKLLGRFTTKEDHENHGMGLGNVEFIVKQYNGSMNIEDLGDEFIVNIGLPANDTRHTIKPTTMATNL